MSFHWLRRDWDLSTRIDRWVLYKVRGKFKATLGLGWLHVHLACLLVTVCSGNAIGLRGILFLILSASALQFQRLHTCSDNDVSASRLSSMRSEVFQASVCVFLKFSFREVNWVHHRGKSPEPGRQSWGWAVVQPCHCWLCHQASPSSHCNSFLLGYIKT